MTHPAPDPPAVDRPAVDRPAAADPPPAVESTPAPIRLRRPAVAGRRVVDLRHPEVVRYERMIGALRLLLRVAFVAALAGLLLPDPAGDVAAAVAVIVIVAAPLVRVGWLAVRWYRRGDRRFAAVAAALLLVVATGSVLALVTR